MTTLKESSSQIGLTDIGKSDENEGKEGESASTSDDVSWRQRITSSIARSRKVRGGNYVQIATVDPETGEPRCRTVVFRGFVNDPEEQKGSTISDSCVMKMITDLRSNKVAEATNSEQKGTNSMEMVWWFAKSSEQYRLLGNVKFVGGGKFDSDGDHFMMTTRKETWGNLSDPAREQFYWKDPGIEFSAQATVPSGGRGEDGKVLPPPDNFLLMLLYPKRVDYLRLGDNYRQIDTLRNGDWDLERVNP